MTDDQKQFFNFISQFPNISQFWDEQTAEMDVDAVEKALTTMSAGEASFTKWLAGVWLHENSFEFDLFNDLAKLQGKQLQAFRDWVNNPFYP